MPWCQARYFEIKKGPYQPAYPAEDLASWVLLRLLIDGGNKGFYEADVWNFNIF